mgnify:CR=1
MRGLARLGRVSTGLADRPQVRGRVARTSCMACVTSAAHPAFPLSLLPSRTFTPHKLTISIMADPYTAKSAQDASPSQKLKEVKGIMKASKCEWARCREQLIAAYSL